MYLRNVEFGHCGIFGHCEDTTTGIKIVFSYEDEMDHPSYDGNETSEVVFMSYLLCDKSSYKRIEFFIGTQVVSQKDAMAHYLRSIKSSRR